MWPQRPTGWPHRLPGERVAHGRTASLEVGRSVLSFIPTVFIAGCSVRTNRKMSLSEQPLHKPRPVRLMKGPLPCSPVVVGILPSLSCGPFHPTHICTSPPAQDPCCRWDGGSASPASCTAWSPQGGARYTGHDGMTPGTSENTWSDGELWWRPHPCLHVCQRYIYQLRKEHKETDIYFV